MRRANRFTPSAVVDAAAYNPKEISMHGLISFRTMSLALVAAVSFLAGAHAMAAGKHDHTPKHGGVVVEANDVDFELVSSPTLITLHVRDHGKVVSTQGATGKLTILSGGQTSEVALAPAGADRLEAKGNFTLGAGTRIVATVSLQGKKPANVRFALK